MKFLLLLTSLILVKSQSIFKYEYTSSVTTCGEVRECFLNLTNANPSEFLNSCSENQNNCDEVCLSQFSLFADCYTKCFSCPDTNSEFPWSCIDECKMDLKPEFGQIVNCLFQPCRVNGFPIWVIFVLVFVILLLIAAGVFIFWRIRRNKIENIQLIDSKNQAILI